MIPLGRAVYPVALAGGMLYAVWLLSWPTIFPADPLHQAFIGDEAVSVIGQRYLIAGPWLWPPLRAASLGPLGTNVALTDSIPLALLLAKPFRAWLPAGMTFSAGWAAFALATQPVAAVFALRSAGERRAVPAICVAVLAESLPTLLMRFGHTALCTHAAILLALGLYLRLVAGRRLWLAAAALLLGCVLIHPYIFVCSAALLAAAPVTLLLRRDRRGWSAGAALLAGCAAAYGLARAFGFGGGVYATAGFGDFSMNLLSPVLPDLSSLFPSLAVDATGSQFFEGYQYLGAGVLLLFAAGCVQAARGRLRGWRRHSGLIMALLALCVLALSNRAFAGSLLLYQWGPVPAFLAQFHATGRFFWPVAYVCVVAGVAAVARTFRPRAAMLLLAAATVLQVADTHRLRTRERAMAGSGAGWAVDAAALRPVMAAHRQLTMWPIFGCGAWSAKAQDIQVPLLASETLMRINTVATARDPAELDCNPAHTLAAPLRPGELRVVLGGRDAWLTPDAFMFCRQAGPLSLCSADRAALAGLPPLRTLPLAYGEVVGAARLPSFAVGWSAPEANGLWSDGPTALLVFQREPGTAVLHLRVTAIAAVAGGAQEVSARLNGQAAGSWRLADFSTGDIAIPMPPAGPAQTAVELRIGDPVRPLDRGLSQDSRSLGVMLRSMQLIGGGG